MIDPGAVLAAMIGRAPSSITRLGGGDLSQCWLAAMPDGERLVLKCAANAGAEADMLTTMAKAGAPVPDVRAARPDAMVMRHVAGGGRIAWDALAVALETLHAARGAAYGWTQDHAFGPLPIANTQTDDWPRFWAENRLLTSVQHVAPALARRIEALAARLPDLLPPGPPAALLHGDLWGGNIIAGPDGSPTLIDPACYYGHREVDWAMLTLFDSPPDRFFAAMNPEPGWRERLPVYRLWPLLVHLRLFGGGYRPQVEAALSSCGA